MPPGNRAVLFILVLFFVMTASRLSAQPVGQSSPAQAALDHFEKKVRPLLLAKCVSCHGPDKAKGGLRMDAAGIAEGGDGGPVVVPGKPDESRLIKGVRQFGDLKMPPNSKLKDQEIADLVAWVKAGAVWPKDAVKTPPPHPPLRKGGQGGLAPGQAPKFDPNDTTANLKFSEAKFTAEQKGFWAFQPVKPVNPPAVKNEGWAKTPVDRFILARLEAAGLSPAAPADKRTLIRRVTFDLTGLPPTPEEIDAFLKDERPQAYAKLVDRLLDSPHYGERWARHWLDVVRYAETTANDGNFVMRYAWRYRDYVVGSFNNDKPYDQFIIEQLAGDLLPATGDPPHPPLQKGGQGGVTAEQVIATGFLMVGPKALAEADFEQCRMDIVDDQIDTTGRTFLGLTLGCARCHDHKYDPVPTVDYYSLAGIFRGAEVFRDEFPRATMFQEWPLFQLPGEKPYIVMAPKEGMPKDLRVHIRGNRHTLGHVVPRRFLQIIAGEGHPPIKTAQSGRLELARWIAGKDNPLTARVMVNRLWQHHFGAGLVATSDNFGMRGERPTHPELLDWLAARFIENGWSVKAMHRLMLQSSTYQMAGRPTPPSPPYQGGDKGGGVDPNNRLLWRMPRHRLEAEALRDSVLAVSGQLDRAIGGDDAAEFIFREGEIINKDRDFLRPNRVKPEHPYYLQSKRRSLYLPVVRNALPDVLALFDGADPNGITTVRNDTTVPAQALYMLNNPFVREQALHLARALLADAKATDQDRLRSVHLRAFGRPPTAEDLQDGMFFLHDRLAKTRAKDRSEADSRLAAWQSYCQMLFCANEFLYVD